MKVSVQLTDRATGEVQVLDVEAATEQEAIEMFDASKSAITVIQSSAIPPDASQQASLERLEHLRQKSKAIDEAIASGLVLKLTLLICLVATLVGCGMFLVIQSQANDGSSKSGSSSTSDAEKALWLKTVLDK